MEFLIMYFNQDFDKDISNSFDQGIRKLSCFLTLVNSHFRLPEQAFRTTKHNAQKATRLSNEISHSSQLKI